MDNTIPTSWENTTVGALSNQIRGVTYQKGDAKNFDFPNGVLVLRGGNVQNGKIVIGEDDVYVDDQLIRNDQYLQKNDVVIVSSTGSKELIGKAAHVSDNIAKMAFGAFLTVLRPRECVFGKYFDYYFQTKYYRDNIRLLSGGVNINNIRKEHLSNLAFPLAPIAEQQRIANKLDALFHHHDNIVERLDRIPALLKQFREKVLEQAVTGELTKEWREETKTGLNTWKIEKARDCCMMVQSGGTPKGSIFSNEGIPFLKVYNIVDQKVNFEYRAQFVSSTIQNSQLKKSITYPGDVLMNIVGPPLGKVAIVPDDYPQWNINQAITLFRPKEYLSNHFLYYFFCEGRSVRNIMPETKGVVGQVNISLSQCREFEIPIPSILEQKEIVKRVDTLFSIVSSIEESYVNLKTKTDQIPAAILAKAFSGELVPQDENDEPASQLLERLAIVKATPDEKPKATLSDKTSIYQSSHFIKSRFNKDSLNAIVMNLTETIKRNFGENSFTFEQLNEHLSHNSKEDYIQMKKKFFELLRNEKFKKKDAKITSEIDKSLGVIKYKLLSNETTSI